MATQSVRGGRRKAGRGRHRGDNFNQEVHKLEDFEFVWLARKLRPRDIALPITTRGIGFSVISFVQKFSRSSDSDYEVEIPIYALYRLCLGLLEIKLWNLKISPSADTYRYVATADMANYINYMCIPDALKGLIDAVGVIEHNGTTYIPLVVQDIDGIPQPENLMLSNLRRAVELLSDPNTPVEHREYFYKHNPIPGAQWDKNTYQLKNANDIIKADYHDDLLGNFREDCNKCFNCFMRCSKYSNELPEFASGPINFTCKGEKSLLISNEMETLRVPDLAHGTELGFYCKYSILEGDIYEYYSISTMSGAMIKMLGECPIRTNFVDPLYILRRKTVAGFSILGAYNRLLPCAPFERIIPTPLTLSVTTRGIGMSVCRLLNSSSLHTTIKTPNIYALFRLCLGILEMKFARYRFAPGFTTGIYRYAWFEDTSITSEWFPRDICRLINTVRSFQHDGITYTPAVAMDTTNHPDAVPRPESLMLSNLRRTVVLLSDSTTPVELREYFYKHNPIPGAKWDKDTYQLRNADDIIQAGYHENLTRNIKSDYDTCSPYFHSLQKHSIFMPECRLEGIDIDTKSEPSHSLLVSNKMGNVRLPDRGNDEELSSYYTRCCPEGNIEHFFALSRLPGAEILLGSCSLLGEYPECDRNDPIYDLRSEIVARYKIDATYKQVIHMLHGSNIS